MKVELFPFQEVAVADLQMKAKEALDSYRRTNDSQVISFQAPTGSGKTIIMAALIEAIYFGTDQHPEQPQAIFVWLSDSPALNEQSKQKIERKADKIRFGQCKIISDESFDQEMLDDGFIYFLNTQKLGKGGNLGRHSDSRQYTIWETLENTLKEKSDHLYFIIDEAHRGMQGVVEAGRATTIMQRFIKGEPALNLSPMPLVIGVSATSQRFNKLVEGSFKSTRYSVISADKVRSSGLLKDRIVIKYSGDSERCSDMAVLQAACDEWNEKCKHWYQYSVDQHDVLVNPVFVIQVQAGNKDVVSATPMNDVLAALEERLGKQFKENEVVHTFGSMGTITINNLPVPHVDPENITDDRRIKVVFFKENLSTGWDCPRAETMMSFRKAEDYTYIAQLLGRMVRTPLQRHIKYDDSLNDVNLFLPYYNKETVNKVIDELKSSEGGDIPTEINGESLAEPLYEIRTIHPTNMHHRTTDASGHPDLPLFPSPKEEESSVSETETETKGIHPQQEPTPTYPAQLPRRHAVPSEPIIPDTPLPQPVGTINREEIVKFINSKGFLTFEVRSVRIKNYLQSVTNLASLLVQTNIYPKGSKEIREEVSNLIHDYISDLRNSGRYQTLVQDVMSFKLLVRTFDIFGDVLENNSSDLIAATESDLDRQLRHAEALLGNAGFSNEYGRNYGSDEDPNQYKIDCILFAADQSCLDRLNSYAEKKFHQLDDDFRLRIIDQSEALQKRYNDIVSNGDPVSRHCFSLPENYKDIIDKNGKEYDNHLFVNEEGVASIELNSWESSVLEEEMKQPDFVCWFRNLPKTSWALTIPRDDNGTIKSMYPDFLIVRRDLTVSGGYVVDIIEPHGQQYADNLSKAKAFAKYAKEEPRIGRIQMCRKDSSGTNRYRRLDFAKGAIREKVLSFQRNEELDHLFETDGFVLERV